MPAAFQEANPDYATAQCVSKDMKIANKGRLWVAQAQHISLAKTEIQQGRGLEENLKGIRKKKSNYAKSHPPGAGIAQRTQKW